MKKIKVKVRVDVKYSYSINKFNFGNLIDGGNFSFAFFRPFIAKGHAL